MMDLEGRVEMLETEVARLNEVVFPTALTHQVGWHLNNTARISPGEKGVIQAVPPKAILVIPGLVPPEDVAWVLGVSPKCHVFIRPYYVPQAGDAGKEEYIQTVESLIRGGVWDFIPVGQRHLQFWNEQNMPPESQFEGFGVTLKAMILFNKWFCIGYNRIKQVDDTWKIGWTPLTPGNRDVYFPGAGAQTAKMFQEMIYYKYGNKQSKGDFDFTWVELEAMSKMAPCDTANVPYYMHGLEAAKANPTQEEIRQAVLNGPCYESLKLADEYIAHIYCMDPANQIDRDWAGLRMVMYAKFFPKEMDVWIMECGVGGEPHWICDWFRILQSYPAVKGTAIWKLGDIKGVTPQVAALRDYTRNLPPALKQPIPYPPPVDVGPPVPLPVPDFTAEPRSGVAPLEVTFTNLSDKDKAGSFRWFFLDRHQDAENWHPVHTFEEPGYYRIILRLWPYPNEQGQPVQMKKDGYINVLSEEPPEPPPEMNFHGAPTRGNAPLSVGFFNTSEGEYENAFRWDFGDGRVSALEEPIHVYLEPGTYDVRLTLYQGDQPFPLTRPGYIEVLSKPEPEPPKVRKYHFAASGTITLTEADSDEPPVDADSLVVTLVPAL